MKKLKGQKNGFLRKIRGSCKDPFLYFGVFSVILLGIIILAPTVFSESVFTLTVQDQINQLSLEQNITSESFVSQLDLRKNESPDLFLVQNNSIGGHSIPLAVSPSVLGSLIGDDGSSRGNAVIEYEVQQGDTLKNIADQFNISLNTLLWANNLKSGSSVKAGQTLIILPVSGVLHYVKSGDTISAIAKKYKASANEIMIFNDLSDGSDITVGDILVIPGGVITASVAPSAPSYGNVPVSSGYFICPIGSSCRKTQGLHWYNAVDLTNGTCGVPIYASAGGEVIKASYGWNSGGGNTIKIMHPNGVATSYGHMQSFAIKVGDKVSQGQIIGYMGGKPGVAGSGISTGCHVHFSFYGIKNPF